MSADNFKYSAWLGLGGNLGDPVSSMARALHMLDRREDSKVSAVSKLYRTPPWGKTDQSWFYNACARLETNLPPLQLLETCLSIEADMKRERIERWGPRTIDIDILVMQEKNADFITLDEELLNLPHPRMMMRAFVLVPLADIAPYLEVEEQVIAQAAQVSDVQGIEIADSNADWWRKI
ncbi:2-amino-4-hydroxy-6-hydroxymethyldihydropteridine pyrophosphokinase [Paenochrobactrum sp. BZR 201-1]